MTRLIFILNGPNLNRLGRREPHIYGSTTLDDIEAACRERAGSHGFALDFRQTNHEGEMVSWIHDVADAEAAGLVINPAALTHTSVAVHDALRLLDGPVVEVHLTNTHAREAFRHHSYVSSVASAVIMGCGGDGYLFAIDRIAALRRPSAAPPEADR